MKKSYLALAAAVVALAGCQNNGGGYSMGAGSELPFYDGMNLAKKDVVPVIIGHNFSENTSRAGVVAEADVKYAQKGAPLLEKMANAAPFSWNF